MIKKRVIIDSDPATGVPFRDVDDGLAILLLLASPEIELEAITINFGNVKADRGTKVAIELLETCGRDVPVITGATSKKQLGVSNPAVEYMIDKVNSNPGEISILAVAPLTNLATAMMIDESFSKNIGELVIMGGSINFGIFSFFGEFNFHLDGRAASYVMMEKIPKTLITMDLISQVVFREEQLNHLRGRQGKVSSYLVNAIEPWLKLNRKVFFRKKGFFPWDPVAAAYLINPALFVENSLSFSVQPKGIRSGRLIEVTKCSSHNYGKGNIPVNVPLSVDAGKFIELLLTRLKSFD